MLINAFLVLDFDAFQAYVPATLLRQRVATLIELVSHTSFPPQELLHRLSPATGWTQLEKVWAALACFEVFSGRRLEVSGSVLAWGEQREDPAEQDVRDAYARGIASSGDQKEPRPDPLAFSGEAAKLLRKRQSAPRWAVALARLLEKSSRPSSDDMEDIEAPGEPQGFVSVEDLWKLLLRHDDQGRQYLLAKGKERRRKERARQKKARAKERRQLKGKKVGHLSSSEDSDSSSSAPSSSSSSSSSSSGPSARKAPRKSAPKSYSQSSSSQASTPRHKNSSACGTKPDFVYIGGRPHFRTRKSGKLVDCSQPPSVQCAFCPSKHWHWEAKDFGCPGPQ